MKFKKSTGFWNPEPNNEVVGKLRSIRRDVEFGDYKYNVYLIETEDSIISIGGSTVLDRIINELNIQIGETIKIKYLGMKKGEKKEYKNYEVYIGGE